MVPDIVQRDTRTVVLKDLNKTSSIYLFFHYGCLAFSQIVFNEPLIRRG